MSSKPNDNPFREWVNLADPRLGAEAVYATDEWFAGKDRLLKGESPVFLPDKFDENGKWMDGWETRRRREQGHDYCIVRLGLPGRIHGVDIDTTHFTGNYPPAASLQACYCPGGDVPGNIEWTEILPSVNLKGHSHHLHSVGVEGRFSHVRLNIYPDGGIARLRVYGQPQRDWSDHRRDDIVDLLAVENGGRALTCNDEHYGTIGNLNMPGRGVNMGDGWETRRRREPGNDWAILALGHPGIITGIEIDTGNFKGNYPDRCSVHGALVPGGSNDSLVAQSMFWQELLPPQKMAMDAVHRFEEQVAGIGAVTHVRLNLFPDGGVSRLRLFGYTVKI
ncbi:MAG: allantoicase [Gammaproteobacteria bacterium]|nr:allantoicase [Gammaproteobacteria bacterium]